MKKFNVSLKIQHGTLTGKNNRMVIANKTGATDGVAAKLVEKINSPYPVVLVSRMDGFVFNDELLNLQGKEWVLFNYTEMGYDWKFNAHHWGINTNTFDFMQGDEWGKLDDFIKNNPPKVSFVRELLNEDVKENVHPISYPCFLPPQPIQTKDQFNKRHFQTIFSWGLSHEYRKTLHADIWRKAGKYGYSVLDNLYYLNGFIEHEGNPKKWLTVNIPWYSRIPMEEFIKINGLAKISISIAGAGRSCFRHCESPVNSVMLMWEDNTAWHQKDWVHGFNCIKCEQENEIETIIEWLDKPNKLYDIYVNGVNTVARFRFDSYIPYLEKLIQQVW